MRYDYDICPVIPEQEQNLQTRPNANDGGKAAPGQKALWRDPAVVAALKGADQSIRDVFAAAGFGIDQYSSGAPSGRFPRQDKQARNACENKLLDALTDGFESGALTRANWNGFSIETFLESLETAKPIDATEIADLQLVRAATEKEALVKKRVALGGLTLGILTIGYVVASSIAATPVIASL